MVVVDVVEAVALLVVDVIDVVVIIAAAVVVVVVVVVVEVVIIFKFTSEIISVHLIYFDSYNCSYFDIIYHTAVYSVQQQYWLVVM